VPAALYSADDDWYLPTEATRSPWHAAAQHGGPPAALAARAVENLAGDAVAVIRFSADLLHEIPYAPLRAAASVERTGRRVALYRAVVGTAEKPVLSARAWTVRTASVPLPPPADPPPEPPPPPDELAPVDSTFRDYADFFGTALDKRMISGSVQAPGRAAMWFRLRLPLVKGEEPTPLQRLVATADSGNGISWTLPIDQFVFVNVDLDLSLVRAPQGEWFALDSVSHLDASGRGLADTSLFDTAGWLGRSTQALFVDRI